MSNSTSSWLELEAQPRVVFLRTPLALALCQIRFSTMLNVATPAAVAPFQEAIIDNYPIMVPNQTVEFRFEGGPSQAALQSSQASQSWRFTDLEDLWTVVLAPDFLTLETRAYTHFSDFVDRMRKVLSALSESIKPKVALRIGLRYINEIRIPHTGTVNWNSTIRKELLGPTAIGGLSGYVSQAVQQLTLQGPEAIGINFQHGMLEDGTLVAPRHGMSAPSGPFYFLDIDTYQEFHPGKFLMERSSVLGKMDQLHQEGSKLFRWAITPQYAATLGENYESTN